MDQQVQILDLYRELYTRFTSRFAVHNGLPGLRKCSYFIYIKRAYLRGMLTLMERNSLLFWLKQVPTRS